MDKFIKALNQALSSDRDSMGYGPSYDTEVNEIYNNYKGNHFPSTYVQQIPNYDNCFEGSIRVYGDFSINVVDSKDSLTSIKEAIEDKLPEAFKKFNLELKAIKSLNELDEQELSDDSYYTLWSPNKHALTFSVRVWRGERNTTVTIQFSKVFEFEEKSVD